MSMQDRPAAAIANSIRMKQSQHPTRTALVVEGQDDGAFFGRYTDPGSCHITVAHGRPKVVEIILELDRTAFCGALGIVDADFEVLEQRVPPSPNILVTDRHDVECMMLASPALDHLLRELGDEKQLDALKQQRGSVVEHLLSMGKVVGYLRWVSARSQWSLKFEGLDFSKFIRKDFNLDTELLFQELRSHQGGRAVPMLSSAEMQDRIKELSDPTHDLWHVCCGHDLVELLSIGLRKVLGQHPEAQVKREVLERQLRLAYEARYFQGTELYMSLRAWEERNPPFRVLPPASA